MKEYKAFWKNALNFSDRTTRKGFWDAILIQSFLIFLHRPFEDSFINNIFYDSNPQNGLADKIFLFIIFLIIEFLLYTPVLSIKVRRLRDINKSWYNLFWELIPILGWLYLIYLFCKPTTNFTDREV